MSLFTTTDREPDALLASGLAVIDQAIVAGARVVVPLFSSGNDSQCAIHVVSRHPAFAGTANLIDTTIGAKSSRHHADEVCEQHGWNLAVHRSNFSYEKFVRRLGFPGPGSHQWVYNKLKDRCVGKLVKGTKAALITGCRSEESVRRMGHVEPVKIGETSKKTGITRKTNRIWTAPCHDWTAGEQAAYMDEHDLPPNPVKIALGMSGECFCGAFASPGELGRIRCHAPDVAEEIDRLTGIALECGTHAGWGTRPPKQKGLVNVQSGPLCSSCSFRANAAGLLFEEPE